MLDDVCPGSRFGAVLTKVTNRPSALIDDALPPAVSETSAGSIREMISTWPACTGPARRRRENADRETIRSRMETPWRRHVPESTAFFGSVYAGSLEPV